MIIAVELAFFRYKIVRVTKFSKKQVCELRKEQFAFFYVNLPTTALVISVPYGTIDVYFMPSWTHSAFSSSY